MEKDSVPLISKQPSGISMFAAVPMRCKSPDTVRDPLWTIVGVLSISMTVELAMMTSPPPPEVHTPPTHVNSGEGAVPVHKVASARGGEALSMGVGAREGVGEEVGAEGGGGGGVKSMYHHSLVLATVLFIPP